MNIQKNNYSYKQEFKGKLPSGTKKAIRAFTKDYLMKQDGYVSSRGSVFNGGASLMRGISGPALTAWLIEEIPKLIHDSNLALTAQISTGLGSIFVALDRFERDRSLTGLAKVKALPFIKQLKEEGYTKRDELLKGVKYFVNEKSGFYTGILPNRFSSKSSQEILNNYTKQNTQKLRKNLLKWRRAIEISHCKKKLDEYGYSNVNEYYEDIQAISEKYRLLKN